MRQTSRFSTDAASEELDRLRFRRALSGMDVRDETVERIMTMVETEEKRAAHQTGAHAEGAHAAPTAGWSRGKSRHTTVPRRLRVRSTVAMTLVAALVATGAYAAVSTDFFQLAFGPKGQEDVQAHTVVETDRINPVTGKPVSWVAPSRTWEDVNEQTAKRLLDGYVFDVGYMVESHGYTLTVGQCVMDENGNGVASITIENPDGVEISDAEYGEVYLSNNAPVAFGIESSSSTWSFWDTRILYDAENSTDTKLVGAVYFGPFTGRIDAGLKWVLSNRDDGGQASAVATNADGQTAYVPTATLSTKTFIADDGTTAELSPIAMSQCLANSNKAISEAVIHYADGSEYVVYRWGGDEPVANYAVSYSYSDDAAQYGSAVIFNRLVDVDAVESIVLRGSETVETSAGNYEQQDFELVLSAS